jgi:hypothetical protein
MNLSKYLFWDTNYNDIDWQGHARYVIERVLTRGTLEDWKQIKEYYGLQKIKDEAIQSRTLDKITLNFCSIFFGIPKEQFRCYTQEQSNQTPLNY